MEALISSIKTMINGPGAPAVAIIISAVLAGVYATLTIRWNRKTVRDQKTIDLVNNTVWDSDFLAAQRLFSDLREKPNGLTNCCNDTTSDDYKTVIQFLNHYELIAIGIQKKILSEDVFKKFFLSRYVKDWQAAKAFIMSVRSNTHNDRLFIEFEAVAVRWEKKYKIK